MDVGAVWQWRRRGVAARGSGTEGGNARGGRGGGVLFLRGVVRGVVRVQ